MKKLLLLITLINALLLSACLPAVFVAGATAGGVVITDRRPFKTIMEDQKISCQALMQLNTDPHLKEQSHISVATFNRVVLLVGETNSPALKGRAFELVKAVPNIRRINNEITISEPLTVKETSVDAWMTAKVKTAMVAEKGLKSTQIKVITEDNVVYLMGLVTHNQADTAVEVARTVKGVCKVVTLFEYTS